MKQELEAIRAKALEAIGGAEKAEDLEALRVQYLGKRGELTAVLKQMGKLSAEERPVIGQLANEVRAKLEESVETRAKRRYDELVEKGEPADLTKIEEDIKERDYRDMHREMSPLRQADDAVLVDSSDMSIEQVVSAILGIVKEKQA